MLKAVPIMFWAAVDAAGDSCEYGLYCDKSYDKIRFLNKIDEHFYKQILVTF